jgi:hypothetical protein
MAYTKKPWFDISNWASIYDKTHEPTNTTTLSSTPTYKNSSLIVMGVHLIIY